MSGAFITEFWALVGDYSRMPKLSDYKLASLIKQGRAEIRRASSDGRLKQTTRESRIQTANQLIQACVDEFVRRTDARAISLFLSKVGEKSNVIQF